MPYPMRPWPTFGEFWRTLESEFSCRRKIVGSGPHRIQWCIERTVNGSVLNKVVLCDDDERMGPDQIRSICGHLRIDPSRFKLAGTPDDY